MDSLNAKLTATELSVLALACQGFTERETAERLFIATSTVHTHLKNIYRKLDVRCKVSAAIWYVQHESARETTQPTRRRQPRLFYETADIP